MTVSNFHSCHAGPQHHSQLFRAHRCPRVLSVGLSKSTRSRLEERAAHGGGAHWKCRVGAIVAKQLDDPWWGATGTRVNRISRETVEKTGENHGLNLNPTLGGFMVLMLVLD